MAENTHQEKLNQKREERKKKDSEDTPSEKRELVMHGAKLKCEFADGLGELEITSNEILLQDKLIATEGDGNNMVNLQFKGKCNHPKWPAQNMSPPPCMSVIKLTPWQNLGSGYMQNQKVLVKESCITCDPIFNSAVAKPITKVASIERAVENEIQYVNGHFYNTDGSFEGKVDEASNTGVVSDVYTCTGKGKVTDSKGKEIDVYNGIKKLEITHEQFCYIAGVVKAEDASTWEGAAATTQATYNAVKYINDYDGSKNLTLQKQSKFAKKLLSGSYSSAGENKNPLKDLDDEKDIQVKNARRGLIHVLHSKTDFSNGATRWDGIDFASKGINHPKAVLDGISISKILWIKFVKGCEYVKDKKGIMRLNRGNGEKDKTEVEALATIPFKNKIITQGNILTLALPIVPNLENDIWQIKENGIDYYETEGSGLNKGRILNLATVVFGRQIFWKPYKEHKNNKGYYWKPMLNQE